VLLLFVLLLLLLLFRRGQRGGGSSRGVPDQSSARGGSAGTAAASERHAQAEPAHKGKVDIHKSHQLYEHVHVRDKGAGGQSGGGCGRN
jgi:hypothetical protein